MGAALGLLGCGSLSFPDPPPAEPATVREAAEVPEQPAAIVAAREMEASHQSWASLAAAGREAIKVGDLEAAEEAYVAAVALTADLDPDDVRSRTALSNLVRMAGHYQRVGRFEDAGRVITSVAAQSLNGRHADFDVAAPVMIAQGGYLERNDRLSEAIRIFEAGLASAPRASLGSRERMMMQRGLALAYIEADRPAEAAPLLEDLRVRTSRVEDGKTTTHAAVLIDIGRLHEAEGNIVAAGERYAEAVALYRELEPGGPMLAGSLNRLAWLYVENERSKDAVPLAKEAMAILDSLGITGPTRAAFLDTLATAETRIGHFTQAEHDYKQAMEERGKGDARAQVDQANIVEHYAALLRETNHEDRAQALERQLAAVRETLEASEAEASGLEEIEAAKLEAGALEKIEAVEAEAPTPAEVEAPLPEAAPPGAPDPWETQPALGGE